MCNFREWSSQVSAIWIRFPKAATLSTILAWLLSGLGIHSSVAAAVSSLEASPQSEGGIPGQKLSGDEFFSCGVNQLKTSTGQLTALQAENARAKDASWTLGQKRLLFIRVDFADLPGAPFSDAAGTALISNLNAFFTDMSYGRAGFALQGAGSEVTPTLRLPQDGAWYGTNNYFNQLRADARDAAMAAGYAQSDFDLDVICFGSVPGFNWNGLGNIGAAGAWLRGNFSVGVAAHELGHNFGLNHANFWNTAGNSVIGPGTSVEYGDGFDTMGDGRRFGSQYHFNARYKNYLDWLTASDISTVTTSGMYRIFAQDDPAAIGLRALRIPVEVLPPFVLPTPGSFSYWVEFRQQITGNQWLRDGAGLRWAWNGNQSSLLLDSAPGTADGKNDSALVIGRTFSDTTAGIHITPIGKGGTSPESLDVVVNLGSFPSNLPPVLTLTTSGTNANPGGLLSFSALASDPDGDSLAYYWEFGDGTYGTNGPAASHSWNNVGEFIVRCRVTDMKGGNASRSAVISVGAPSAFHISGRITIGGAPLEGVRVFVSDTQMAYSDSDGDYVLAGLAPGSYEVGASLEGYTFDDSAFSNPVSVGPDALHIDFFAATVVFPPYIATQPRSQTVRAGTDATFFVEAGGTPPLTYLWKFNGSIIEGALDSIYTRTNVQSVDEGNYTVIVSNKAGMVTSAAAALVLPVPPTISSQPSSQIVNIGSNATFSVIVAGSIPGGGTSPLQYQWYFNTTNLIDGADKSSFTIVGVQDSDAGYYSVAVDNGARTTSSNALLTVNHLPVAGLDTLYRAPSGTVQVAIGTLLSNDTDVDGDLLALISFSTNSAQGGTVTTDSGSLMYVPPPGLTNADEFTYLISDGRGGTATGTVEIQVFPSPTLTIIGLGNGSYLIRLEGISGENYRLEYTDGLEQPNWQPVGTSPADDSGIVKWTNSPPAGLGARFYRSVHP